MHRLRKLMALILAVCMIISVPMSVDVAAVGNASQTDFYIAQALAIPQSWGISTDIVPADRGILLYFTGGNIGNVYDQDTSSEPHDATNHPQQSTLFDLALTDTLYSRILITICNEGNWSFGDVNNSPLVWSCSMGVNSAVANGPNNYYSKVNGSVSVDRLPTNRLTAEQIAKYTTAIDTLDEIFMLAEDLGGKVQYRLWEQGSQVLTNGLVECYYESGTYTQLAGQLTVNASGIYNNNTTTDIYDCAIIDVTRVGDGAVEFESAEFIADENSLKLTFSEGLHYAYRGNNYLYAGMRILNGDGQLIDTITEADGSVTYKTHKEMVEQSISGYSLLQSSPVSFETMVPSGRNIVKCFMTDAQVSAYKSLLAHVDTLNQADPDGGYQLCYVIEEKNSDFTDNSGNTIDVLIAGRGESSYNHFVDSVWNETNQPLLANYSNSALWVPDSAIQPIVAKATDDTGATGEAVKLLSVVTDDPTSYRVTMTFDRPVNIDSAQQVYMTYTYDPSLSDEGFWQQGVSFWQYLTEGDGVSYIEVDGVKYSNKVVAQFGTLSDPMPTGTVVRFCEYSNPTGAVSRDCLITPAFIHDANGNGLRANALGAGNADLTWAYVSMADQNSDLLAATPIASDTVRLHFGYDVTYNATDAATLLIGGTTGVSVTGSGKVWDVTVADPVALSSVDTVKIPTDAFTIVYDGGELTEDETGYATVMLSQAAQEGLSDITDGTAYSFMNADTGREIAVDGISEFTAVSTKLDNVWLLKAGDQYLDLTGTAPALTQFPIAYAITEQAHERYQIRLDDAAVTDTDDGTDLAVTLGTTAADTRTINSGWYLTAADQTKPLRILPFGDSITYGVNPDVAAPKTGWRDDLSQDLTNKLDRFVFVGNQVTYTTTLDDATLTRHEGNPGWTIKDHGTRNGIYDLVPGLINKYDPDVVCMMIGINDMAAYGGTSAWSEAISAEIQTNYTDLVEALALNMDDTDTIFCSTLTPMTSDHSMAGMEVPFNEMFVDFIPELAKTYPQVKLNDNYNALLGKENVVSSDGIHLSLTGDTYVAQAYANSIMNTYAADGSLLGAEYLLQTMLNQAKSGDTVTLQADYDSTGTNFLKVPVGVTLDLNGYTVKADNFLSFGQVLDSTEGTGGLYIGRTTDNGFTLLQDNNIALPLYDTAFGGYRFFSCTVTNKTPRTDEDFVKYGANIKLGSEDAYRLLLDSANVNVSLSMELDITGNASMTYTFNHSILAQYATAVLNNMARESNLVITLKISGLHELAIGSTVTATPTLTSVTRVLKTGAGQTHTRPLYTSDIYGTYTATNVTADGLDQYFVTLSKDEVIVGISNYDLWDTFYAASGETTMTEEELWNLYLADGSAIIYEDVKYIAGSGNEVNGAVTAMTTASATYGQEHTLTYSYDTATGNLTILTDSTGILLTDTTYAK